MDEFSRERERERTTELLQAVAEGYKMGDENARRHPNHKAVLILQDDKLLVQYGTITETVWVNRG